MRFVFVRVCVCVCVCVCVFCVFFYRSPFQFLKLATTESVIFPAIPNASMKQRKQKNV